MPLSRSYLLCVCWVYNAYLADPLSFLWSFSYGLCKLAAHFGSSSVMNIFACLCLRRFLFHSLDSFCSHFSMQFLNLSLFFWYSLRRPQNCVRSFFCLPISSLAWYSLCPDIQSRDTLCDYRPGIRYLGSSTQILSWSLHNKRLWVSVWLSEQTSLCYYNYKNNLKIALKQLNTVKHFLKTDLNKLSFYSH